jgi:ABC-type sugar transport system substrate-binding protein
VDLPKGGAVTAVSKMPKKHLRLAALVFQNNPFWFPVRDGIKAATTYLGNFDTTVDYIVMGDDLSADKVQAAIETAVAKQYDGIIVAPFADGTEAAINKAVDAGIPVVTIIGESSKASKRIAFIGQNVPEASKQMAQEMEKYMNKSGKYGIITGNLSTVQHEQRKKGVQDYLKKNDPNIKEVGVWEAHDSADKTYSIAKDMLTANPDLKAIYCTAGGPYGAAKAVKELGLTGKVGVFCYDWVPDNLKYVKSGEIVAAIDQDPFGMGFNSLVTVYNYIVGGVKPESYIPTKGHLITPQTFDQIAKEQSLSLDNNQ